MTPLKSGSAPKVTARPRNAARDAELASSVAALLKVLECGEDAATRAFAAMAKDAALGSRAVAALGAVAREEADHDRLVKQLLDAVGSAPAEARFEDTRRMHLRLGRGALGVRLARVAGIDSAVCQVLSALLRAASAPLAQFGVCDALIRIRKDEARHVAVAREIALSLGGRATLAPEAEEARARLATSLEAFADDFERLDVDAGRLITDIRRMPAGLLS